MVVVYSLGKKNTSSSEGHNSVKSESIFKKYEWLLKLLKRSFKCDVARGPISIGKKVIKENILKSLSRKTKKMWLVEIHGRWGLIVEITPGSTETQELLHGYVGHISLGDDDFISDDFKIINLVVVIPLLCLSLGKRLCNRCL